MTKYVTWTRFKPKCYGLKKIWSKNLKKKGAKFHRLSAKKNLKIFTGLCNLLCKLSVFKKL